MTGVKETRPHHRSSTNTSWESDRSIFKLQAILQFRSDCCHQRTPANRQDGFIKQRPWSFARSNWGFQGRREAYHRWIPKYGYVFIYLLPSSMKFLATYFYCKPRHYFPPEFSFLESAHLRGVLNLLCRDRLPETALKLFCISWSNFSGGESSGANVNLWYWPPLLSRIPQTILWC